MSQQANKRAERAKAARLEAKKKAETAPAPKATAKPK